MMGTWGTATCKAEARSPRYTTKVIGISFSLALALSLSLSCCVSVSRTRTRSFEVAVWDLAVEDLCALGMFRDQVLGCD